MPTGTVSDQCNNLLESLKKKLIKVKGAREHLVKLLGLEKYNLLNKKYEAGSNEELYKFLYENYKGAFKVQAQAISNAAEDLTKATELHDLKIKQSNDNLEILYKKKDEKIAEFEQKFKDLEFNKPKEKEELECKLAEAKKEFTLALIKYLESEDNRGEDDPLEGKKELIESYERLKQETENKQFALEDLNKGKEEKNAESKQKIESIENDKCIKTENLKGELEKVKKVFFTRAEEAYRNRMKKSLADTAIHYSNEYDFDIFSKEEHDEIENYTEYLYRFYYENYKDEFKKEVTAISNAQQALAEVELQYNNGIEEIQNETVAFNNKVDKNIHELQKELGALEDEMRKAIETLYESLHENYECKDNFKEEVNAISDAQKALAEDKVSYNYSIELSKNQMENEIERLEFIHNDLDRFQSLEREKLNDKLEEAKNEFTSVVKTFLHSEVKWLEKLYDISEFSKLLDDYEKCKEGCVRRLEEYLNLISEFKKSYDSYIDENYKGNVDKAYLEKLQGIGKEIDSFLDEASKLKSTQPTLFAKSEVSESKDEPTQPIFSARANSGFANAMDYLKKNQNTLRNIAGGLLATVFIYNTAAVIAGFNAFALMASIATLTSTLPLVLALVEIALITFAGTSLIAYTAASDKVRTACSLKPLTEPSTNPNGSNGVAITGSTLNK